MLIECMRMGGLAWLGCMHMTATPVMMAIMGAPRHAQGSDVCVSSTVVTHADAVHVLSQKDMVLYKDHLLGL